MIEVIPFSVLTGLSVVGWRLLALPNSMMGTYDSRNVRPKSHIGLESVPPESNLVERLRRTLERCRKTRAQSQQCRRRAEELTAQAERFFTKLEVSNQWRSRRRPNGPEQTNPYE